MLFCRKNRTWERDRRERLNNTFERLAKLLPDYEAKVTLSKIDILQKTIAYIEELKVKFQDVSIDAHLHSSRNYFINCTMYINAVWMNPSLFPGSRNELEECLRALKIHNDRLVNLLQKSHIAIPPFVKPILLDKINNTCDKKLEIKNNEINKFDSSSQSKICEIDTEETVVENTIMHDAKNSNAVMSSDASVRATAAEVVATTGKSTFFICLPLIFCGARWK